MKNLDHILCAHFTLRPAQILWQFSSVSSCFELSRIGTEAATSRILGMFQNGYRASTPAAMLGFDESGDLTNMGVGGVAPQTFDEPLGATAVASL